MLGKFEKAANYNKKYADFLMMLIYLYLNILVFNALISYLVDNILIGAKSFFSI